MPPPLRTELNLAADARLLPLVADYLRGLADLAALPRDQAELLTLAVTESCRNIMQYGFDEEDSGTLTLVGELTPKALTLSIRDQGCPFDETMEADYLKSRSANPDLASRVRPMLLLHQGADEVRWINHGPEGNECRLTKYLSGVCRLETPQPAAAGLYHEPTPQGCTQDYTIRLLQAADAIRVARLMYAVYGYSYSNEDFYFPERLAHDLETGTHVGVVAVADNGEIVGHVGVMRPDLGPLAELGQLAVAPAHRGQGLKQRMGDRLQAEIRRLGLTGLFAEAVTVHTISQEGSENRGLHATALKLLDWQARFKKPQTFERGPEHPQGESNQVPQRETLVLYFKYLAPPETVDICAPSRHREMLARIYAGLETPVHFLEASGPTGPGRLAVHYDRDTGMGTIQVNRIGSDTLPEIYQARRDLCALAGAAVVGLDLPLAQGGTPHLCDAAEADGFFFSGVRPHFAADGDFLRLQYLNTELDPERIHLAAPFARELLDYVLKDRERVRQIQRV